MAEQPLVRGRLPRLGRLSLVAGVEVAQRAYLGKVEEVLIPDSVDNWEVEVVAVV